MNPAYYRLILIIGLRVYDYIQRKRKDMTPEQKAEWDKQWVGDTVPKE
jgi:hypothetical protein